ncbi:MAG: methyl-accepting chemotaxis protein, partial [Oscillospiraceae bacterium]|nr:methyl-accepting chemotaxis protein [Oscillospiraceae bacterium]
MKNMKVSMKLIVSFVIVIVLCVIVGGVGIFGMLQINNGSTELYQRQARPLATLGEARELFQRLRVQIRNVALNTGDYDELLSIERDVVDRERGFIGYMDDYKPTITAPDAVRLYDETMAAFYEYQRSMEGVLASAKAGEDQETIMQMIADMRRPTDVVMDNLSTLSDARVAQGTETSAANDSLFSSMLIVIIVVLILAVVVALSLALYISGLISKPLVLLSTFMNNAGTTGNLSLSPDANAKLENYALMKDEIGQTIAGSAAFVKHVTDVAADLGTIAGGDLTIEVDVLSPQDIMGKSLQQMLDNLNTMFSEINSASNQVSTGSKQIADGAQSLAQGSTEQAASVQELSASIGEIAQKTKENATMAERAATLAGTIMQNAEKGSTQM